MKWYQYLWPWGRSGRERIEAEKEVDRQFKAQLQEALLRQDDLKDAVEQIKRARKGESFRQPLGSQS
jgi:hypothetical protein